MSRHNKKHHRRIRSRHHVRNRCRGGKTTPSNIIELTAKRHQMWHILFQNMSFLEAAALLIRADSILKSRA